MSHSSCSTESSPSQIPYLHFTNKERDCVCRCLSPFTHERCYPVEDDILLDTARHHFARTGDVRWHSSLADTTLPPQDFNLSYASLHYTTNAKDCVCRCSRPSRHGKLRPVRNADIHSLATKHFELFRTVTCSKTQWRSLLAVGGYNEDPTVVRANSGARRYISTSTPTKTTAGLHHPETSPTPSFSGQRSNSVSCERERRSRRSFTLESPPRRMPGAYPSPPRAAQNVHTQIDSFTPDVSNYRTPSAISVRSPISSNPSASRAETNVRRMAIHADAHETEFYGPRDFRIPSSPPITSQGTSAHFGGHEALAREETHTGRKKVRFNADPTSAEQHIPNRKDFVKYHTTVNPFEKSPHDGWTCSLCTPTTHQHASMNTIRLDACEDQFHELCFLHHLRCEDKDVAKCPTCQIELFEHTPVERLMADKSAIFGDKFSKVHIEINIDYPDKEQYVECRSEEQLAVVQLRILRGNVKKVLDATSSDCRATGEGFTWYSIVHKALSIFFYEDEMPIASMRCQYMPNEDALLQYLAWAELTRLVNQMRRARTPDQVPLPFPPVSELLERYRKAKERYAVEKVTWRTDSEGNLPCDLLAEDMFQLVMASLPK